MRQIDDLIQNINPDGSITYQTFNGAAENVQNEDVTVTLNDGTTVLVINGVVTVKLPNGQIFSAHKDSGLGDGKVVGGAMMTAGGVIAAIPAPPWAQIIGAVIAAAGALISAFTNGKAARKAELEAGRYDASNIELKNQNAQLDQKIADLQNEIINAKQALGVKDTAINGLGWCLINCAKTKATTHLKTAKELFNELSLAQNVRIETLEKLTKEAQRVFNKSTTLNYIYIGAGVLVTGAVVYYLTKRS